MHVLEIPKVIMSTLSLRNLIMRLRLHRMNNIRELDSILNKENRNIIPNNIPVAFRSVHLHREATNITHSIRTPTTTLNSRKANKDGSFALCVSQDTRRGKFRNSLMKLEGSEGSSATGMHDSFGNPFVVEAHNLHHRSIL